MHGLTTFLSYASLAGLLIYPPFLIFRERRFWGAFGFTWFLLVVAQVVSDTATMVEHGSNPGVNGVPHHPTAGLVLFSGWMLAFPYCVVMEIAYRVYRLFRPGGKGV